MIELLIKQKVNNRVDEITDFIINESPISPLPQRRS